MKTLSGWLAVAGLLICVAAAVAFFYGRVTEGTYKTVFLAGTVVWFVFATIRFAGAKTALDD